jgi:hypothetical protein
LLHLAGASAVGNRLLYAIEFSQQADEPVVWLRAEGFELKFEAQQLATRFSERGLVLETDGEHVGLFVKELDLPQATRVRVTWGVERYPQGVDWDGGNRRGPLAVMFWLGDAKIDSGAFYVPDSPYFTAVFLGDKEQEGKAYTGRYYKKGGRYFCQPCRTPEGETVVTEFDLELAFKRSFGDSEMPPVSGFGFQVNTKDTRGGSRSFLKRVEFLAGS